MAGIAIGLFLVFLLFVANGIGTGWKTPEAGRTSMSQRSEPVSELRVLALNVAKCFVHEGGVSFASVEDVEARLDRIAEVIERERLDLVCLSEVVIEAGPVPINQVEYLARHCGFAHFASGENYSFGLPWYRIRSGNAVLSSFPLMPLENVQLSGRRPFWSPTNNRRALWCEVLINGDWLLVGSIRNDSFDLENNLEQTREILAYVGSRPALLAGDFNSGPDTPPFQLIRETRRFSGIASQPATFPAPGPTRRIDHILAPASWVVLEQRVVDTGVSDHLAVVTVFEVP